MGSARSAKLFAGWIMVVSSFGAFEQGRSGRRLPIHLKSKRFLAP
jgi:hypothetical protein